MTEHFELVCDQETPIKVAAPGSRYELLQAEDGRYAAVRGGELACTDQVDDNALWRREGNPAQRYASVCHELIVDLDAGELPGLEPVRGPHALPSELLGEFRRQGWVILPELLAAEVVDGLQRTAGVGQYSDEPAGHVMLPLLQHEAVARATAEPVSLWLMRAYFQTPEIGLAHPPSLAVLDTDDGQCNVQGWHADYPYLWGAGSAVGGDRVPQGVCPLALGIQRNICITEFTKGNGATVFKLGSHTSGEAPPAQWGHLVDYLGAGYRAEHGLPYGGCDTQTIEAPAGSIILYDARTWHRAGVNRSSERRAAMLQAVTPTFVLPFVDMSGTYKAFVGLPWYARLDARERRELETLFVRKVQGGGGAKALGVDEELTRLIQPPAADDAQSDRE